MLKELHMRPYMVTKKKVCLKQIISIGLPLYGIRSFHGSFHHF